MLNYLQRWIGQLRWQRLEPFQKLAMLVDHLEGILNYCRTEVPQGAVEATNDNINALMRRGRGYRNLLPAPQSAADGRPQDLIRRPQESGLIWASRRIPAQAENGGSGFTCC